MLLLSFSWGHAGESGDRSVRLSLIIDDLGDQQQLGLRAVNLPGPLTYAFLPHTPFSQTLAAEAHRLGKEVMLHLPMQAMSMKNLGPGGLTLDMNREHFIETLRADLASVPHVAGINNHMGSLLTRHPGHMAWLMEELQRAGNLYFIDSRTTRFSVAAQLAREQSLPVRNRDVFLDDDPDPVAIKRQLKRLENIALKHGSAIGIGHPYETTLEVLAEWLPRLEEMGITLVTVSSLLYERAPAVILATEETTSEDVAPGPLVYRHEEMALPASLDDGEVIHNN